jgi:hypothetical protein
MNYKIKRGEQEYGPYTLAELQRYVASGNVLLTDLCQSEAMTDWIPVQQVIGNIPVPAAAPAPTAAGAVAYQPSAYPLPPNLHWGIAVLLGVITCGLFGWVWAFVQAAWLRKVQPSSKAMIYFGLAVGLSVVAIVISSSQGETERAFSGLLNLFAAVLWLVASFSMRNSIEEHYITTEPLPGGFALSGVMTFFFNIYYFQYHFTHINEMRARQGVYA